MLFPLGDRGDWRRLGRTSSTQEHDMSELLEFLSEPLVAALEYSAIVLCLILSVRNKIHGPVDNLQCAAVNV